MKIMPNNKKKAANLKLAINLKRNVTKAEEKQTVKNEQIISKAEKKQNVSKKEREETQTDDYFEIYSGLSWRRKRKLQNTLHQNRKKKRWTKTKEDMDMDLISIEK